MSFAIERQKNSVSCLDSWSLYGYLVLDGKVMVFVSLLLRAVPADDAGGRADFGTPSHT